MAVFDGNVFDIGVFDVEAGAAVAVNYGGHYVPSPFDKRSKRRLDEAVVEDLKRALGMLEDAPPEVAAPIVEVLQPYVAPEIRTVPPAGLIDWRPFIAKAKRREALRRAIAAAEARRLAIEEEEDDFLLLAA